MACFLASPVRAAFPIYTGGFVQGIVDSPNIFEASGLAASRQNPGVLWTHNDNNTAAWLYAIRTNGQLLASWSLDSVFGGDFEDIAIGPGPRSDLQYIYFGDIGDNDLFRSSIRVARVAEPAIYFSTAGNPPHRALAAVDSLTLTYPDGPHDAETLMVDPVTGDLFILTKDPLATTSRLYRVPKALLDAGGAITLQFVGQVAFRNPSAGDISVDGREIILRRGSRAQLWLRGAGMTVPQALAGASIRVPVVGEPVEPNGEAVAFHGTGLGYYTLSEGTDQPLYFFRRSSQDAPTQPLIVMPAASLWTYFDLESEPPPDWMEPDFNDASWSQGPGKLGYGHGDEGTVVSFGYDMYFKVTSTYFRTRLELGDPLALTNLQLRLLYSDGIALYLNGEEIFRNQLAVGAGWFDPALAPNTDLDMAWMTLPLDASLFQAGENVLAAEVHRFDSFGPTLTFDLQIVGEAGVAPLRFTEVPVLNGPDWRLSLAGPTDALVEIQGSTNLVDWMSLGTVRLTNGAASFLDGNAAMADRRFYRGRLLSNP